MPLDRRRFGVAALALVATRPANAAQNAHDFTFTAIEGGELPLSAFAGRPVLVVNTASECGFTPQYKDLQTLWSDYRERGLVILAVPSDTFNQELADEAAVKEFCTVMYGVDFPMTEITELTGARAHPFYAWAARLAGAPRWNFHKYLIGPDGALVRGFPTSTRPTDPAVIAGIEALLAR